MIKRFQQLTKASWRDRFKAVLGVVFLVEVILIPINFLVELILVPVFGMVSLFARTTEKKGFDDPVYKKNLQRLIERNRRFEEERNDRHS